MKNLIQLMTLMLCITQFGYSTEDELTAQMRREITEACSSAAQAVVEKYGNLKFSVLVTNDEEKGMMVARAIKAVEQGVNMDKMLDEKKASLDGYQVRIAEAETHLANMETRVVEINQEIVDGEEKLMRTRDMIARVDKAFNELYVLLGVHSPRPIQETVAETPAVMELNRAPVAAATAKSTVRVLHLDDQASNAREMARLRLANGGSFIPEF